MGGEWLLWGNAGLGMVGGGDYGVGMLGGGAKDIKFAIRVLVGILGMRVWKSFA